MAQRVGGGLDSLPGWEQGPSVYQAPGTRLPLVPLEQGQRSMHQPPQAHGQPLLQPQRGGTSVLPGQMQGLLLPGGPLPETARHAQEQLASVLLSAGRGSWAAQVAGQSLDPARQLAPAWARGSLIPGRLLGSCEDERCQQQRQQSVPEVGPDAAGSGFHPEADVWGQAAGGGAGVQTRGEALPVSAGPEASREHSLPPESVRPWPRCCPAGAAAAEQVPQGLCGPGTWASTGLSAQSAEQGPAQAQARRRITWNLGSCQAKGRGVAALHLGATVGQQGPPKGLFPRAAVPMAAAAAVGVAAPVAVEVSVGSARPVGAAASGVRTVRSRDPLGPLTAFLVPMSTSPLGSQVWQPSRAGCLG